MSNSDPCYDGLRHNAEAASSSHVNDNGFYEVGGSPERAGYKSLIRTLWLTKIIFFSFTRKWDFVFPSERSKLLFQKHVSPFGVAHTTPFSSAGHLTVCWVLCHLIFCLRNSARHLALTKNKKLPKDEGNGAILIVFFFFFSLSN